MSWTTVGEHQLLCLDPKELCGWEDDSKAVVRWKFRVQNRMGTKWNGDLARRATEEMEFQYRSQRGAVYDTVFATDALCEIVDSDRLNDSQYHLSFVGTVITNAQCSEFHVDIYV